MWMTLEVWLATERGRLLEGQKDPAYLLSSDGLKILWVNSAFRRFCTANGGDGALAETVIGRSLLDFVPGPLQPFYEKAYSRVFASGEPARHDYECSAPQRVRWFAQYILPDQGRLVILNTVLVSRDRKKLPPVEGWGEYLGPTGFVTQCSHCRRIRNCDRRKWELHEESFVLGVGAPRVTHGLCEVCVSYFFDVDPLSPCPEAMRGGGADQKPSAFRWLHAKQ